MRTMTILIIFKGIMVKERVFMAFIRLQVASWKEFNINSYRS